MVFQRVLSAVIAIPILLAAIYIGDPSPCPVYSIAVAVAAVWAVCEMQVLAGRAGHRPLNWLGLGLTFALVANAYSSTIFGRDFTGPLLAFGVSLTLCLLLRRPSYDGVLADWALTVVMPLYTGGLLSYFVLLRHTEQGLGWVALALFSAFAADSAAFFVGRRFGRERLAPRVSPSKTWEGAVGGLAGAVGAVLAISALAGLPLGLASGLGLGLLVAFTAQVGDLAESMLKRSAGTKDASQLIPGHGGMLDRIDSLVFTVAVVYYFVVFRPF